jgi:site-specific DNA-adenine methylase
MCSYHGGKQRIGKQLANFIVDESIEISEDEGFNIKGYCEPFCGMLGVYQHIPELYKEEGLAKINYKAGDTNKSVIMMWKEAQKGWKPPKKTTEKEYNKLWRGPDTALKGYIGHQYSFGGQFFNGFAPKYGKNPDSTKASNKVHNIATKLKNVSFYNKSYTYFSNLKGYIIYCDPPYEKTNSRYYESHKKKLFDSEEFWEWCRNMSEENIVFVSSYNAPDEFEEVFSSTHKMTGINTKNKKRTEKLFLI